MKGPGILWDSIVRNPSRQVALVLRDRSITYGELRRLAEQLANSKAEPGPIAGASDRPLDFLLAVLVASRLGRTLIPRCTQLDEDPWCSLAVSDCEVRVLASRGTRVDLPDETAALFATSGITGHPVWIAHSEPSLLRTVQALLGAPQASETQQVWLTLLPLHTTGGFTIALRVLCQGDVLVVGDQLSPSGIAMLAQKERVNCLAGSPALLGLVASAAESLPEQFPHLNIVGTGGSVLSPVLGERLGGVFGAMVVDSYGSTELGGAVLLRVFPDPEFSVLDSAEVAVDSGGSAPGELRCRVSEPYLGEVAEEGVFRLPSRRDDMGWLATGDQAILSPTGTVQLLGRRSLSITRGDVQICVESIESELDRIEGVARSVVLGVRSSSPGHQRLVAIVQAEPNAELDSRGVLRRCRAQVDPLIRPNIVYVAPVPLTASGKPDRLRAWEYVAAHQPGAALASDVLDIDPTRHLDSSGN